MTDQELVASFQEPTTRNEAFNLLIKKYQQKIYWHIRKMVINHDDADDLTQETFIKVWQALPNFRGDSQLFTWIYRIATNECLTHLNKKRRQNTISLSESLDEEDNSTLLNSLENAVTHNDISGDEIQLKLQKALLTLPDKQRLVFNMKYYDDMKYEEISEITGTSVGALKASYHIAAKKIEDFLNED